PPVQDAHAGRLQHAVGDFLPDFAVDDAFVLFLIVEQVPMPRQFPVDEHLSAFWLEIIATLAERRKNDAWHFPSPDSWAIMELTRVRKQHGKPPDSDHTACTAGAPPKEE